MHFKKFIHDSTSAFDIIEVINLDNNVDDKLNCITADIIGTMYYPLE